MPGAQAVSPPPDGDYLGGNTAEGFNALFHLNPQDGAFNTAVGWYSLFSNVTGSFNTALGAGALDLNTSHNNTAVGAGALFLNTTGTGNTATGAFALVSNGTGDGNTAVGAATLTLNITGAGNTAVGAKALLSNNGDPSQFGRGSLNTAIGLNALTANTIGGSNTAVGAGPGATSQGPIPAALGSNTTGFGNTAVGSTTNADPAALGSNTTGNANTAVGANALSDNTTGDFNTAVGKSALGSNTTGNSNIAVGVFAGRSLATGDYNIDIGNEGMAEESNTIRIGTPFNPGPPPTGQNRTFIAGISGVGVTGAAVFVNTDGQLGVMTSSARFKDEIRPMDKASNAILALKPVTFRYKKGIDPQRIPQFGLAAEEVEKVNADLVVRDKEGKPYSVRYEAVNAMLLNEFLKEHKTVQEQGATIARLQTQIEALTAGLQKVSAQLEVNKPAPQVVASEP
jgi:hypothetical protein